MNVKHRLLSWFLYSSLQKHKKVQTNSSETKPALGLRLNYALIHDLKDYARTLVLCAYWNKIYCGANQFL